MGKSSSLSLWKRMLTGATLIGIGLGGSALLFEAAARFVFPVSDYFWEWDEAIGVKLIPGKKGRFVVPGEPAVDVEINSAGFRDREHTIEKPAGTRRIVLVGDSFLEALQVPFEESVTAVLEERVNATGDHNELISLSVSGAGTAREYLALREYGLRYSPDLVLLFVVGNDYSDNSESLKGVPYIPYPVTTSDGELALDASGDPVFTSFRDQTSRLGVITGPLRKYSRGYHLMLDVLYNSPRIHSLLYRLRIMSTPPEAVNVPSGDNFGFYEIYRMELKPAWAEAWRLTEGLILETRELALANGAAFCVVLIPTAWEVNQAQWDQILARLPRMAETPMSRDRPSNMLTEFLGSHDVPVVNLLPEFRTSALTRAPLYLPDGHWTAEGHTLAAELLAEPVGELLASVQD